MEHFEDDELAAFRRAPDEWHRLKEEQQGQLMRDCNAAAGAFLDLVHRDVLSVQKSLPTIVGASKSTVRRASSAVRSDQSKTRESCYV